MAQQPEKYHRHCPGEERSRISDAVCNGRRRANFTKCKACQFNTDRRGQDDIQQAVQRRAGAEERREMSDDKIAKVFKAYDVRAMYPDPLNEEVAWRIGYATSQFLRSQLSGVDRADRKANTMVVGRDMRLSSPSLQKAFIDGALATGADVIDIGQIDTSQIYFAINHLATCGGVQVTASHNPAQYNGLKVTGPKGKAIGQDSGLEEIKRLAMSVPRHESSQRGQLRSVDLAGPYKDFVRKFLQANKPIKVAVDASNGMAGKWFPILFDDVPGLRITRLNYDLLEKVGKFVHEPNPLVDANLRQLQQVVRQNKSDFGACFDGDADRCVFVDENGAIVRSDFVTALLAKQFLKDNPGSTIVYDLRSSWVLKEEIERAGGVPKRQRVGHVFMKRTMADTNAAFGGELSGHFYFRDNWYCDSGMLAFVAVLNLLASEGKPLSKLIAPLCRYATSGERNFHNEDKDATIEKLLKKYADGQVDTLDGVTVQYADWWFNVRKSNTEPLLRLNLEAKTKELMDQKLADLTPLLGTLETHP
jgi:phosphomannomutase